MSARIFVYGTLQDERLVERLLGRRPPWQPAVLEGYCRMLDASIGYPVVHPLAGASVDGRLLEAIDPAALAALDAYEGGDYRRVTVRVQISDGRTVDAYAYVPVRPPASGVTRP
ncbi:MAG TPA: gamma-glutamylcyclotransferase family protein [bacterium]|nr:gamma-glutamylcyclotransferase family protein [bacterium]